MRIAVTGGAGFLGTRLARELLRQDVALAGAEQAPVDELVVVDVVDARPDLLRDDRVRQIRAPLDDAVGDLGAVDAVFHLAGVVSGAAEADFDLGMATNLDGMRAVLEWGRAQRDAPLITYSSSLAVYGSDPAVGPIGTVDDDTLPRPQSSYGVQKFIGEQLLADYTRRGFVRGRGLRLMTVAVRPGRPNRAASSFMSGIIREPLAGEPAMCPVAPDTAIALSSPRKTIEGILRAAATADQEWGSTTAMNLPSLTTTPAQMVDALRRIAGDATADLVTWGHDPAVEAIVDSWPSRFVTARAARLGLTPESSFDDIIRAHLDDR